jgi:hypothetical protein
VKNPDAALERRPFVVTAFAFLFLVQIAVLLLGVGPGMQGRSDFRHLYTAGYMVRTGQSADLYDYQAGVKVQKQIIFGRDVGLPPFNHLAFEALFFAPLSYLKFSSAYLVFLAVNVALVLFAARMAMPYLGHLREQWVLLPAASFVCFLPLAITLIQGQDSIILLVLFMAAFVCAKKGHEMAAGLLLSLTMFKFQFAIVMALLFLMWRMWKIVAGFAAGSVVVTLLSLAVTRFSSPLVYLKYLISISSRLGAQEQLIYAIDPALMPNLRGMVYGVLHAVAPNSVMQWMTAAISLLVLAWAIRSRPSFENAVLVATICSYHCLIHDTSILLLPLTLLAAKSKRVMAMCGVVYGAPAVLFLANEGYWPIGFALLGLFALTSKSAAVSTST